jgi:thioredoxin-dependent peroxiredoxin
VGVSKDSLDSHKRFAAKYALTSYLLADPDGTVLERLGVRNPITGMAARTTFVIDKSGIVRHVYENVSIRGHVDVVLAAVARL